jgi:hypothetical protein
MSLQPVALRKHGTRTHSQFFKLIEGYHASPLISYQIIVSIFQKQSMWETAASGP